MRRHTVRAGPARATAAAVAFCAAAAAAAAQQQPQFRAGVELVVVDVNVIDRDGRPVSDLRLADFTLNVDGRPRPLVSAEFVSLSPAGGAARPAPRPAATVSDGFSANDQVRPGRLFLLAIDQSHLRPSSIKGAVEAAGRFLDLLNANDQVGLVAFPEPGPSVGFTMDRDRVKQALGKVAGRPESSSARFRLSLAEAFASPQSPQGVAGRNALWQLVVDRECSTNDRLGMAAVQSCAASLDSEAKVIIDIERRATEASTAMLRAIVERLGDIEGAKTLVLITEGLPSGPGFDVSSSTSALASVGRAAMGARVTVYAVQLDRSFLDSFDASNRSSSGSVAIESDLQANGLEAIAGPSRGAVFKVTARADRAYDRVIEETSAYYLLSFESTAADRDGKPHRIGVRVSRSGTEVRSRPEFVAGATRSAPKSADEEVTAMLGSPLVVSSLPLRLGAFVMRDASSPTAVRTLVAADIDVGVRAPAQVTLGLRVIDATGKVMGDYVKKETLKPFGTGEAACLKFSDAFLVSPGEYTLKLAVVDGRGRRGSAVHKIVATIPRAGNIEMSDLLLIDPTGGGAEGGTPAVTSTIAGEAVGMYLEIYYPRGVAPKDVKVTVDVANEGEGPAIFTTPAAVADRPDQRRFVATAIVAAPLLPPGSYLARALVELDGRPVGRAQRLFHVVSPAPAGGGTAARSAPRNLVAFGEVGSLVRPFTRSAVLGPDVVNYFLKRMEDSAGKPSGQAVLSAIDHVRTGQLAKVLADLASANSDDLAVAFLRGLAKFSNGELQPAIDEFHDALRISSEFLPAVFYLGACYAASGHDRDAVGAWQLALLTESDARIVYDVLADAYIRLGDSEQAEAIMNEAMAKWADDDVFVPRLAAARALAGRDAEAMSVLGAYLERRSDDEQTLFLAVRLLYEALAKGRVVWSSGKDRAEFLRYATLYTASKGVNKEIVARWAKFVESQKR
jgi:VWFA-related protein